MNLGMGGHQSHAMGKDEWLTPPKILRALGEFDLDPCAPINRPWEMAKYHYTIGDNGLHKPWYGRVWMNPPYGPHTRKWLERLAHHGNGIALIFARTETVDFHKYVWDQAHAVLFLRGRLMFHHVDGTPAAHNGGAPSVLVAYGVNNTETLRTCGVNGKFILLKAGE